MNVLVLDDPVFAAASAVKHRIRLVQSVKQRCVLAVPGGSTPGPVLNAMRDDAALLRSLTVTLVDERHLPFDKTDDWRELPAESNTRLLYAELVDGAAVKPHVLPWAQVGSLAYTRSWLADKVPDPDVLLLGMGPDGHIASLFPGHPEMQSTERILAITDSPKPPPERLSMSLPVLNAAAHAVIVVRGAAKAEALARAYKQDPLLPTTYLTSPEVLWIVDPEAASQLPESP